MSDVLEPPLASTPAAPPDSIPVETDRMRAERILAGSPDDAELVVATCNLLVNGRFEAAFRLARPQVDRGVGHPGVLLALAVGGLVAGDQAAAAQGLDGLRAAADALSAAQRDILYNLLLKPIVPEMLLGAAFYGGDTERSMRILQIVTAACPALRPVFDLAAPAVPVDIAAMRRRGAAPASLTAMPAAPPPIAERRVRRAVLGMRDLVFPRNPRSRPHEVGPRIHASMAAYGWQSSFSRMAWDDIAQDYADIAALCEQQGADVLLLDEQLMDTAQIHPLRAAMLQRLRRSRPALQVIGVYLDPWMIDPQFLREAAASVDLVWSTSTRQPVWHEPGIAGKCLFAPFPHAFVPDGIERPLQPRMVFSGGVACYNWHRAFWLTAAGATGAGELPIEVRLSTHNVDGLSPLESSSRYMQLLAETTCSLNFSMRPDLSRIATGRSFETCLAGALLVQEASPELDDYLVAGEHYLEFASFAELRGIARFLQDSPEAAEAVRRRGHAFVRQRYGDDSIVGLIDARLTAARLQERGQAA